MAFSQVIFHCEFTHSHGLTVSQYAALALFECKMLEIGNLDRFTWIGFDDFLGGVGTHYDFKLVAHLFTVADIEPYSTEHST